jgi:EAL domain-containing protein (putative c-di-GMP-specific phosphodiesterase class I)
MEREVVRVLFLEHTQTLSPVTLKEMRTLQKYKDLIGAAELSTLITNGSLTTHFQPIVDLKINAIYGYESLARGVNDDGSLIYPDRLFKWAREGDMLFYLDRACRESSLKTAAVKNIHNKVFINFIPTAIYDPEHCLQSTVKWAKQLEFDPKNIIFEVIESDHVEDLDHLKRILDFYKAQGFMVALDDVGSGYSSLNMIAKLLPDIVKIDRAIIDQIDTNEVNQSIFRAITQIAHENNIIVLAEGIERAEEVAFCSANGADLAQGYYFGKPNAEPIRKLN